MAVIVYLEGGGGRSVDCSDCIAVIFMRSLHIVIARVFYLEYRVVLLIMQLLF